LATRYGNAFKRSKELPHAETSETSQSSQGSETTHTSPPDAATSSAEAGALEDRAQAGGQIAAALGSTSSHRLLDFNTHPQPEPVFQDARGDP